jgi:hypothetical protein
MRQTKLSHLMGAPPLLAIAAPANAHFNGSHELGAVSGILHLTTEPTHVMLLAPAVIILLIGLRKIGLQTRLTRYAIRKRQHQ